MDEVTTFFEYIQMESYQPYYSRLDANNHILNSFLTHLSWRVFGDGIFFLRLPNILAFLLFAYYGYRFYRDLANNYARFAWIVLLFGNLYFITFFNICRGYGLSFAFLLGVLYHFKQSLEDRSAKHFHWALLLNGLMIVANLSLLTWAPLFFLGSTLLFFRFKRSLKQYVVAALAIAAYISVFIYFYVFARALQENGSLYASGGETFYEAIFIALSRVTGLCSILWGELVLVPVLVLCLLLLILNRKQITTTLIVFMLVAVAGCGTFIFSRIILHVNYPPARASIQLYLLLVVSFILALDRNKFRALNYFSLVPCGALIYLFVSGFTIRYASDWSVEAIPANFIERTIELNRTAPIPLSVSCDPFLVNTWNFYNYTNGNKVNYASATGYPDFDADLLVVTPWYNVELPSRYDTIGRNDVTCHLFLRKRKEAVKPVKWTVDDVEAEPMVAYELCRINLDTGSSGQMNIGLSYQLYRNAINQHIRLKAYTDRSMNVQEIDLRKIRNKEGSLQRNSMNLNYTADDTMIMIRLSNNSSQPMSLSDIEITIDNDADVAELTTE